MGEPLSLQKTQIFFFGLRTGGLAITVLLLGGYEVIYCKASDEARDLKRWLVVVTTGAVSGSGRRTGLRCRTPRVISSPPRGAIATAAGRAALPASLVDLRGGVAQ